MGHCTRLSPSVTDTHLYQEPDAQGAAHGISSEHTNLPTHPHTPGICCSGSRGAARGVCSECLGLSPQHRILVSPPSTTVVAAAISLSSIPAAATVCGALTISPTPHRPPAMTAGGSGAVTSGEAAAACLRAIQEVPRPAVVVAAAIMHAPLCGFRLV
eukprot:scaffold107454_cov19-Tisochrysis_lutea.AAC.1